MSKCMLLSYRNELIFLLLVIFFFSFSLHVTAHDSINGDIHVISTASSTLQPTILSEQNHIDSFEESQMSENNSVSHHIIHDNEQCVEPNCKDHHSSTKCNDSNCKDFNLQKRKGSIDPTYTTHRPTYECNEPGCKEHKQHIHHHPTHHHHHHHHDHSATMVNTLTEKIKTLKIRAMVASAIAIGLLIFAFVMKRK